MLLGIFRSVFVLGVVSWYSMSIWRLIDDYFKEQFQRYLEKEFHKNPKMRDDVLSARETASDGVKEIIPMADELGNGTKMSLVEEAADLDETRGEEANANETKVGDIWELEEAIVAADDNEERDYPRDAEDPKDEKGQTNRLTGMKLKENRDKSEEAAPKNLGIIEESRKTGGERRSFSSGDGDFLEFEEESQWKLKDSEDEDIIRIKELPYKPLIDIYNLDRVSRDEFCPLDLEEDEESCYEIKLWGVASN